MCAAQEDDVLPWQRYASGDVNNNSINSDHGHQPKRYDGPVEVVLLRKNMALPGHSQSVMVHPQTRAHTDKL